MISFPKPLIAAVNGQAIGCGVAILPLCDIVYASDKATFYTPYTQLGQPPEAALTCTLAPVIGVALVSALTVLNSIGDFYGLLNENGSLWEFYPTHGSP